MGCDKMTTIFINPWLPSTLFLSISLWIYSNGTTWDPQGNEPVCVCACVLCTPDLNPPLCGSSLAMSETPQG